MQHQLYDIYSYLQGRNVKKIVILTATLLTLSLPTLAQESPVEEMFRVMEIDKQMSGGFEAMMPIHNQMANHYNLDAAQRDELKEVFRSWFNNDLDREKIKNEIKVLYTQAFTNEEIIEVTNFYKTRVGQKFLAKNAELMQLTAQIGMQEGKAKEMLLMKRMDSFFEKHNIKR